VGQPHRPGSGGSSASSPLSVPVVLIAICAAAVLLSTIRNKRPPERPVLARVIAVFIIALLISAGTGTIPAPVSADASTSLYLLPVTVKNIGGSETPAFSVTMYLDGEKITTKSYDTGIPAGHEVSADIPIHTSPGSHMVKIVADEEENVKDANRGNNVVETTYAFS
jgi:hypothetical protein